jgi:hypothetical protein
VTLTVTTPTTPGDPFVIAISAISGTYPVVTVWRTVGAARELVAGSPLVLVAGAGTVNDALYPLSQTFLYELRDSTGAVLIETAGPFDPPQPSGPNTGRPIVRDIVQTTRAAYITIVDVTSRIRRGRVSVYQTVGVSSHTAVGDVRLLSEGQIAIVCTSHADRDEVLFALSSGGPCALRVPFGCQLKVDEMYFTPLDIVEERFGTQGRCALLIDFVEVRPTATAPLPPSVHVTTYQEQTANAATAAMTYNGLTQVFIGRRYADLSLSRTGIAP